MTRKFGFLLCFFLAFVMVAAIPSASQAQVAVGVSIRIGPPPLRVYAQPICPGPDYLWTPGYWAYGPDGYYWVPGAWVMAPEPGLLWTPGYWGFADGLYVWHLGYWGPHVGFYGGIHYGYGYTGVGYYGGEWRHGHFFYNRSVTNINIVNIHNTYNRTVIVHNDTRVAFNGEGGIHAEPNRAERDADRERHFEATREQVAHRDDSRNDRANHFDNARDNRDNDRDHFDNGRGNGRNFQQANRENRNGRDNFNHPSNDNRNGGRNDRRMNQHGNGHNEKNNHPQKGDRDSHPGHPHR